MNELRVRDPVFFSTSRKPISKDKLNYTQHKMSLQKIVRESFADHGILPFRVKRVEDTENGNYLYIENLPIELPAETWLPLFDKSVPEGTADTYLYIGACTIVSSAVAAALHCDVMKVALPPHTCIYKVYTDAAVKDLKLEDVDELYHTDHLVVTKMVDRLPYVLDLTGAQIQWDASILNQWVPLKQYLTVTKSSETQTTSPYNYMTKKVTTSAERDHQASMWAIYHDLKEKNI